MYPEDLLHDGSPVDYVVIGEGEETFTELAKSIDNGHGVHDVQGIAWFDGQSVCRNLPRPTIENLDTIPVPLYEYIDTDFYFRPGINIIREILLSTAEIFTSRGCPSQCTFCVNKNLNRIMGSKNPFRQRSVKNVIDEIEYLAKRYGVDGFYICDDTFCIQKEFVFDFCTELAKRDLRLVWGTETRVNLVSQEMIRVMNDAGCIQLDFGVESGSPQALKRMKKGITLEQIRNSFRWCHEIGVRPMANFMFNTPGETEDNVQKTLVLAKEIDACYYGFNLMTPFPGTDIYEEVEPKLTVTEYSLYQRAYKTLIDPRFKFAQHNLDLDKLVWEANVSFNSFWKRFPLLFNLTYLKKILKSRKKSEYLSTLLELIWIFVRSKWNRLLRYFKIQ
jgi:radical SAM superfamily enzyme YgiQ (UPF0313 family)